MVRIRTLLRGFGAGLAGIAFFFIIFVMPLPTLPSATLSDFAWAHLGDPFSQRHLAVSYALAAAQGEEHASYRDKSRYWSLRAASSTQPGF